MGRKVLKLDNCQLCPIFDTCVFGTLFKNQDLNIFSTTLDDGVGCPWSWAPFSDKKIREAINAWEDPDEERA